MQWFVGGCCVDAIPSKHFRILHLCGNKMADPAAPPPKSGEVVAAEAFLENVRVYYEKADLAAIGSLYGEDSGVVVDGTIAGGLSGIAGLIAPRFSAPVYVKWGTVDAQMVGGAHLLVLTTGQSTMPEGNFTSVFALFPQEASALGMYAKVELLRFGPGTNAFNYAADASGTGSAFAAEYYKIYNENRMGLGTYYREGSSVTFEGRTASTLADIAALLEAMPKGSHELDTLDVVPVGDSNLLIMVTGKIRLEGEANPLPFAQVFELAADEAGPYIANEMWRFVLA